MVSKDLSDQVLIQECRQGKETSFTILFERYFNRLYKYSLHYVKDNDTAKELVMDVMFRLWEKRQTITFETDLAPYLYRSIKNAIYNHWRKKALETTSIDLAQHDHILLSRSADYELRTKETGKAYQDSLMKLSPQSRLVYQMSREEDLSHAQIADSLNLSVNTVKNHMKTALNFFRKNLKQYSELTTLLVIFSRFF
jgi:RNA polymerase sigma-70 factor (family 1)